MTQLTEQRFEQILDKQLKPLATKAELKSLATKKDLALIEKRIDALPTKVDLQKVVDKAVEHLALITKEGFDGTDVRFAELRDMIDVQKRMKLVEHKLQRIEEALHIKL